MQDFKELTFNIPKDEKITYEEIEEVFNKELLEKLNISISELKQSISDKLYNKAEELTLELPNIVPYQNYEKVLEDNDSMAQFLKTEGIKLENWKLRDLREAESGLKLFQFTFYSSCVDDGDVLSGHVFIDLKGKIKHSFVKVDI